VSRALDGFVLTSAVALTAATCLTVAWRDVAPGFDRGYMLVVAGLDGVDAAPRWRREPTRDADPTGQARRFVDYGPFAVSGKLRWTSMTETDYGLTLAILLDRESLDGRVAANFDHFHDRGLHWFTLGDHLAPSCTLIVHEAPDALRTARPGDWISVAGRWGEIADQRGAHGSLPRLGMFAVHVDSSTIQPAPEPSLEARIAGQPAVGGP
jgi:hypothetical protein